MPSRSEDDFPGKPNWGLALPNPAGTGLPLQAEIKRRCFLPVLITSFVVFLRDKVSQFRVVLYPFHLILNDLQHIGLYLRVVAVNLLLHDVVAVLVPELVDDRDFLVGFHFFRHFRTVHDDAGMENLLLYLLSEVVGHAAHEHALREVGNLGGGDEGVHLRIDGSRGVLPVDGDGLPLLEYLAEPFRQ